MNPTVAEVQRAIDLIEARLACDIALRELSQQVGCSAWHLHRVFTAVVGETPAGYARRRRLGELCRQLVETRRPLVELALDGGFESQPAFTRAFTRMFGVSPGRYRRAAIIAPAHCYPRLEAATLVANQEKPMEPRIDSRPAIHVVGLSAHFTPETRSRIPALWSLFVPRIHEIPHRRGAHTLGVCIGPEPDASETGFGYMTAVEVERFAAIPAGMVARTLPASTYAVYTHRGHIARFSDTVDLVFGRWLPASPYVQRRSAPDLELYDARWDPQTGLGEIDILVPISLG